MGSAEPIEHDSYAPGTSFKSHEKGPIWFSFIKSVSQLLWYAISNEITPILRTTYLVGVCKWKSITVYFAHIEKKREISNNEVI